MGLGNGVADLRVGDALDVGDDEADLADAELIDRDRLGRKHAEAIDLVVLRRHHQADLLLRLQRPVDDTDDDDHTAIGVVPGIEDQRLQRRVGIARRRMEARDDRLEDVAGAGAFLGAGQDRGRGVEADDVLDLSLALVRLRARQVDLVDDRDDVEVVVDGQVGVGQRLRLDALRGIDEQQRAFARGQRPRDLVPEVHVSGRVDQIEDVLLSAVGGVVQSNRVRLDRDAALTLEVHGVEDLRLHLARLKRAREFEEAICQRRLAMVDVRDDRKISDVALIHRGLEPMNCTFPLSNCPIFDT